MQLTIKKALIALAGVNYFSGYYNIEINISNWLLIISFCYAMQSYVKDELFQPFSLALNGYHPFWPKESIVANIFVTTVTRKQKGFGSPAEKQR